MTRQSHNFNFHCERPEGVQQSHACVIARNKVTWQSHKRKFIIIYPKRLLLFARNDTFNPSFCSMRLPRHFVPRNDIFIPSFFCMRLPRCARNDTFNPSFCRMRLPRCARNDTFNPSFCSMRLPRCARNDTINPSFYCMRVPCFARNDTDFITPGQTQINEREVK